MPLPVRFGAVDTKRCVVRGAARLGREPTAADVLRYVKDKVAAKNRPFGPSDEWPD